MTSTVSISRHFVTPELAINEDRSDDNKLLTIPHFAPDAGAGFGYVFWNESPEELSLIRRGNSSHRIKVRVVALPHHLNPDWAAYYFSIQGGTWAAEYCPFNICIPVDFERDPGHKIKSDHAINGIFAELWLWLKDGFTQDDWAIYSPEDHLDYCNGKGEKQPYGKPENFVIGFEVDGEMPTELGPNNGTELQLTPIRANRCHAPGRPYAWPLRLPYEKAYPGDYFINPHTVSPYNLLPRVAVAQRIMGDRSKGIAADSRKAARESVLTQFGIADAPGKKAIKLSSDMNKLHGLLHSKEPNDFNRNLDRHIWLYGGVGSGKSSMLQWMESEKEAEGRVDRENKLYNYTDAWTLAQSPHFQNNVDVLAIELSHDEPVADAVQIQVTVDILNALGKRLWITTYQPPAKGTNLKDFVVVELTEVKRDYNLDPTHVIGR